MPFDHCRWQSLAEHMLSQMQGSFLHSIRHLVLHTSLWQSVPALSLCMLHHHTRAPVDTNTINNTASRSTTPMQGRQVRCPPLRLVTDIVPL